MRSYSAPVALYIAAFSFFAYAQNAAQPAPKGQSQGMPPRATPADYPSQIRLGPNTMAAEFMGHSVPKPEGPLSTEDYVVVETAFFGPPETHVTLSRDDFSLRINGKKKPLPSESYVLVDRSLKDPEWAPPTPAAPKSKTGLSSGGQGNDGNLPVIVHVPIELQRSMAQYIEKAALPEGDRPLPKAGLLFFQYRGAAKSIHKIELTYSGALGKATLELQP